MRSAGVLAGGIAVLAAILAGAAMSPLARAGIVASGRGMVSQATSFLPGAGRPGLVVLDNLALLRTKFDSKSSISPVDVVIAVDESGSISALEMTQERQAARLIALGEFAPDSKIAVIGFGGANSQDTHSNPQQPVDQVCPLTQVSSAASRQGLSDCISQLHVRTGAEGDNTDFISVIDQAVGDLAGSGDTGRPRLMFLLTDGMLDVYGDPAYSGTAADVAAAAQRNLLQNALPAARRAGAEIWPLGFGSHVDLGELRQIAAGGAQGSCSALPDATPHAITVANAAQAETELRVIYADARCLGLSPGSSATISGGQSLDLRVAVPVIATDGTIEVVRQDPRIQVTFYDPAGHQVPVEGPFDGSTFQLAGTDSPVEALTITDPLPGGWRVHLQAPAGMASASVNASVLWQGRLRSDIVVSPPQPRPGQRTTLMVRLQVRGALLVSPSALAGVTVRAVVSGAGFTTAAPVLLADNGKAPDATAGDGVYSGYLVVPHAARGQLSFAGEVTGQGVVGDERHFTTTIAAPLALSAQLSLGTGTIRPGGRVAGALSVSNPTGSAHTIRMILAGAPRGVTVNPPTIQIPAASGSTTTHLTMSFQAYVPHGPVAGELRAVDPGQPSHVYAQAFIGITIAVPRPWWRVFWWTWILAAAVLIALIAALRHEIGQRRARRSVEDIEMVLYGGGREIDVLQAPLGCGRRFAFSIDTSRSGLPRLETALAGSSDYVARRRSGSPGLFLTAASGGPIVVEPDSPVALGDGLALGFRDLRLSGLLAPPSGWEGGYGDATADSPEGQRRWWRRRRDPESLAGPEGES